MVLFEAEALARVYVIQAREEASALDVIPGTFSIVDFTKYALINFELRHLYL